MNSYTAQTTVRMSVDITVTVGGAAVDPGTLTCGVRLPDLSVLDLTSSIVRDSAGKYHADYTPTSLGLHMYEWRGVGPSNVAKVGQFMVTQRPW